MQRSEIYITTEAEKTISVTMKGSASDNVTIEIKKASDNYTYDFTTDLFTVASTTGTMDVVENAVAGTITCRKKFTPDTNDTYNVIIYNSTENFLEELTYVSTDAATSSTPPDTEAEAGLTNLQIFNRILKKLGEKTVNNFSGLSSYKEEVLNEFQLAIVDIASWMPFTPLFVRDETTLTLATGVTTYTIPSGIDHLDDKSFCYNRQNIYPKYLQKNEVNKKVYDFTVTGDPKYIWREGSSFEIWRVPTASQNGKIIRFDYYQRPAVPGAGDESKRCWIPAPYERTLLFEYVVYIMMGYNNDPETSDYEARVFGGLVNGKRRIGSKAEFENKYGVQLLTDIGVEDY